jgi:hypothetical protein
MILFLSPFTTKMASQNKFQLLEDVSTFTLTPWNKILEKLKVTQLIKKFFAS